MNNQMRQIFTFIFLLINLQIADGQEIGLLTHDSSGYKTKSTYISSPTQQIKNPSNESNNLSFFEKYFPAIVALLIGVISALINLWVSHTLKKSNEKNLQRQIDNAKETTITQFKATIAAKNRQDWINEVRQELSELIANGSLMRIELKVTRDIKEMNKYQFNMHYSLSKIETLLNPEKPEQKLILADAELFVSNCTECFKKENTEEYLLLKQRLYENGRKLFGIHWTKIKNLK
jgi:hypothetical protein